MAKPTLFRLTLANSLAGPAAGRRWTGHDFKRVASIDAERSGAAWKRTEAGHLVAVSADIVGDHQCPLANDEVFCRLLFSLGRGPVAHCNEPYRSKSAQAEDATSIQHHRLLSSLR
jgi:hypothetical protein